MVRAFLCTTQVILLLTALGKIIEACNWKAGRNVYDPLFGLLGANHVLVMAALIEVAVVVAVWRFRTQAGKALAILWMCLLFVGYRIGLWIVGFHGYCSCLGHWKGWLHLTEKQVDTLALISLAFMLCGSLSILTREALIHNRGRVNDELRAKSRCN